MDLFAGWPPALVALVLFIVFLVVATPLAAVIVVLVQGVEHIPVISLQEHCERQVALYLTDRENTPYGFCTEIRGLEGDTENTEKYGETRSNKFI